MAEGKKKLSHDDIWDDSALVDSWNEAVEEYKYYHSLHARGEKVEDVLAAAAREDGQEMSISQVDGNAIPEEGDDETADNMETEIPNEGVQGEDGLGETDPQGSASQKKLRPRDPVSKTKPSGEGEGLNGAPAIPQHLVGTVHDEGLKSLLMSWYYAGYYTGLYEGQHLSKPTGG